MRRLQLERFKTAVVASTLLAVLFVVGAPGSAHAQRDSFDALVDNLKSQDHVECTSPPMMWLARLVVRAMQPEGVLDVRFASFEGRGLSRVAADDKFGRLLERVSGDGWSPLVRVRSRRNGEISAVHFRQHHKKLSLLVLAINRGDAVVIEVSLVPETLRRWIGEPSSIVRRAYSGTR